MKESIVTRQNDGDCVMGDIDNREEVGWLQKIRGFVYARQCQCPIKECRGVAKKRNAGAGRIRSVSSGMLRLRRCSSRWQVKHHRSRRRGRGSGPRWRHRSRLLSIRRWGRLLLLLRGLPIRRPCDTTHSALWPRYRSIISEADSSYPLSKSRHGARGMEIFIGFVIGGSDTLRDRMSIWILRLYWI